MNIARTIVPMARQNVGQNFYRKFRCSATKCESSQATQPQVKDEKFDFEDLKVLERTERRKPKIESFIKNVFVSTFNRDLLAFPEILNKEESEELDQRVERLEKVFDNPDHSEKDRHNTLKQYRMFAAPVSLTNGGLSMNVTERIRYLETISTDLKLAKLLSEHWVCLEALKIGLKAEEFEKVLPKLTAGDKTIAMCTKETVSTRIAQADFRTKAELDTHGVWRVSGEKECYREYDCYLVLCVLEAGRLQAFLVEADAEGVNYQAPHITFRDSPGVPLSQISEAGLSRVLGLSRLDVSVMCHAALRRAAQACAEYVRGKFVAGESLLFTGKPLAELPTIRARVGSALMTAYAAESAAYFTAGLLDGYEEPDADVEMALCRNFVSQHCAHSLLALQGVPGLQQSEDFHRRLDDMRRLMWDETDDNVNMFIALNGIHHAGKTLSQEIKQIRNPLLHPSFIFKKVWADRFQESDKPKLTLYLAEHLHPTLKPPSELLEYCVLRMRYACESVMGRHGKDVFQAHTELERLSLAATEILAMTAVLARASRSYCIGLRNSEIEMRLAACFVEQSRPRVRQLILDLEVGEYLNLDHYKMDFGKKVLDNKNLLVEKATERVFW